MDEFGSSDFEEGAAPLSPLLVKKRGGEAELGSLCTIKIARQATRTSNQRAEGRRSGTGEETIIRFRDRNQKVTLVNRSSSGAMIESDIEPFIGEPLQIQIGEGRPVPAVARWVGGGRIGVEYGDHSLLVPPRSSNFTFGLGEAIDEADEDETGEGETDDVETGEGETGEGQTDEDFAEPAESTSGDDAQREPRQAVIRRAMVRAGVKRVPVRLCNISSHGVMLESDHCLAPGSAVQLEMAGGYVITAEVRWSSGKRAGLSFDQAINPKGLGSMNVPPPSVLRPTYLDSEFDPSSPWAARFDRLTMRELHEEPTAIPDADAPPSWQLPER